MTFKLKLMITHRFQNLGPEELCYIYSVPSKCNNKAWMMSHLFKTWLTDYFKPFLRPTAWRNRFFQNITSFTNNSLLGHPRGLMEWWTGTTKLVFSCLVTQRPFCSSCIEESLRFSSLFFFFFQKSFCNAVTVILWCIWVKKMKKLSEKGSSFYFL